MRTLAYVAAATAALAAFPASAGPDLECNGSSQVEISQCVNTALEAVDNAVEVSLGFAMGAAGELDSVTGRASSVPALEAAQAAWSAYRDAHCEHVGATYGGGSGTGIAIASCRVMLGRDRVEVLLDLAN
ncbi:lysozyme inhibitor LprI family protein [Tropicimonas aquimaris]|uniref:Lysozyme inhibitor LprI family protein n=1 Tax=Tropicimonas aquimaris TaxID=914152 RepID=A0ABW3IU45_9RHOB